MSDTAAEPTSVAEETRRLVRRKKLDVAQRILNDEDVPLSELESVSRLEIKAANLVAVERIAAMTRWST